MDCKFVGRDGVDCKVTDRDGALMLIDASGEVISCTAPHGSDQYDAMYNAYIDLVEEGVALLNARAE